MTTSDLPSASPEPSRRLRFDWILPAFIRPRATFAAIAAQVGGVWLVPLLILTVFALARTIVTGSVQQAAMQSGQFGPGGSAVVVGGRAGPGSGGGELTPEQQQQFEQAQSLATNPLVIYGIPSALAIAGTWLGWLIVGSVLHLVFTLLGGRGSTRSSLNIVAWAALPFALRDLVRLAFMLAAGRLIMNPGLSGFAPMSDGVPNAFCVGLLSLVDLYLIWHVVLIGLGLRASERVTPVKAWGGAAVTLGVLMLLQALPGYLASLLGSMAGGGF
jgi:hypothetical protein